MNFFSEGGNCWEDLYQFIIKVHKNSKLLLQMFSLYMSCQMTLLCSLIVTLITSIFDTFMYRLNMFCQTTLLCSLIVTLITIILDTIM